MGLPLVPVLGEESFDDDKGRLLRLLEELAKEVLDEIEKLLGSWASRERGLVVENVLEEVEDRNLIENGTRMSGDRRAQRGQGSDGP